MFNELLRKYPTHIFGLIALHKAYEGMNNKEQCKYVEKRILESASVDNSSMRMLEKHGNLLKETKFYDLSTRPIAQTQSRAI